MLPQNSKYNVYNTQLGTTILTVIAFVPLKLFGIVVVVVVERTD